MNLSRRKFLAASAASMWLAGCVDATGPSDGQSTTIRARPGTPTRSLGAGRHPLALDWVRDGFIYVPASYRADTPAPLAMLLHGAGGSSANWSDSFLSLVDDLGIVLVGADSRAATWDLVALGGFGPDVHFLDLALSKAFDCCNIDPKRVALAGFSDGATYALSLGLCNGDLFKGLMAFSPGALIAPSPRGSPRVFIAHGTEDTVIPVGVSRNVIVPDLRQRGYDVTYNEFVGPHAVSRTLARQGFEWLAAL